MRISICILFPAELFITMNPQFLICVYIENSVVSSSRDPYFLWTSPRYVSITLILVDILSPYLCLGPTSDLRLETYTRCDNKVRELSTDFLTWQQWTETSVCFDDVGISAFQSCVVVDLCQSLSEWSLLLSECVLCAVANNSWILSSRHCTCSHGTVCEGVFS
jgi:hypothetical protein